jgi:CRISPR-associated protein Csh2
MSEDTPDTIENRSEIVFLYDAEDCNPNGNPLSANDKPRVDETTGQAVVTDVRLKRYIRDQLDDDGFGIYVRNPSKAPYEDVPSRDELFRRVTDLSDDGVGDLTGEEAANAFLENAVDVRYFGATCSFSEGIQDEIGDEFPGQFIGPVQFEHARSMHTVVTKSESKQLSTVVASESGDEQGTFATDNRLEYALVKFHGVVNENAAEATQLTDDDVERLDSVCWRALKNQTLTRSKMGHQPRVYLRVEYDAADYHSGALDDGIRRADADETDGAEYRNITDVTLDASSLLEVLAADAERIDTVHVKIDDYVTFELEGEQVNASGMYDALKDAVGEDRVDVISVYDTDE